MLNLDVAAHNEHVREIWRSFSAGTPVRMPVMLGINPRIYLQDPQLNTERVSFEAYTYDPAVMLDIQLKYQDYVRHNILADHEMGVPREGWQIHLDFQNIYEAAYYGAEVRFFENNCPCSVPFLTDENKYAFPDRPLPGPFDGIMHTALSHYEYFQRQIQAGYEYRGAPVAFAAPPVFPTDGPFTVACSLRGAAAFCLDLLEDPEFADALLEYLTESIIERIRGQRRYAGLPERLPNLYFADDSITLLSREMYRERILPLHQRLVAALGVAGEGNTIHLCGDATRHFKIIRDALNVTTFDTGFPVDHGALVQELGPDVQINGGVPVSTLKDGTPQKIAAATDRICAAVERHTKRFVMRDANNVPAGVPVENLNMMYETVCKRYHDFVRCR